MRPCDQLFPVSRCTGTASWPALLRDMQTSARYTLKFIAIHTHHSPKLVCMEHDRNLDLHIVSPIAGRYILPPPPHSHTHTPTHTHIHSTCLTDYSSVCSRKLGTKKAEQMGGGPEPLLEETGKGAVSLEC